MLLMLPFAGCIITALLPTRARTVLAWVAGIVAAIPAAQVILLFPQVRDGGVLLESYAWVPSLGLDIVLRMDGFAWIFAVIIPTIGVLVFLYARSSMSPDDPVPRFYPLFLALLGALRGLCMARSDTRRVGKEYV